MAENKTAMVVSAHSADFVWRAGGAVALYAARGWRVVVVCLSFGERGESAKLWRESGMTLERVKATRKDEALRAAEIMGAEVTSSIWATTRCGSWVPGIRALAT